MFALIYLRSACVMQCPSLSTAKHCVFQMSICWGRSKSGIQFNRHRLYFFFTWINWCHNSFKMIWTLQRQSKVINVHCYSFICRLLSSSAAEEVCDSLTKVLGINPLLLRELDLSGKIQGDSEMKKIADLLEDSHCKVAKLKYVV